MRVKKRLGQHFLRNREILKEIVQAAELSKKDAVLEVGPGTGELTEFLAGASGKVIAVEKDSGLIPPLRSKFKPHKNVKIIEGDILQISKSKFLISKQIPKSKYKIVANIPYYITSRFLRNVLEARNKPKLMVLMVQYEVAKRICARPPEMNLLALSVQAYGRPKLLRKVSKGSFAPPPEVDSAVIKISDISDDRFRQNKINPEKFFDILRRAFQQKRKMLRHSLKNLKLPEKYFKKRPQELSLEDWFEILN